MTICMAVTNTNDVGTTFVSLSDTQITIKGNYDNPLSISPNLTGVISPRYNGIDYSQLHLALKTILINRQMVILLSGDVFAAARLKRQLKLAFGGRPERNRDIISWFNEHHRELERQIDFTSIAFMVYFCHDGRISKISSGSTISELGEYRFDTVGSGSDFAKELFNANSCPWNLLPGTRGIPCDITRTLTRVCEAAGRAFLNEVTSSALLHSACNGIAEIAHSTSSGFKKFEGIQNLFVLVEIVGNKVEMSLRAFSSMVYHRVSEIDEEFADLVVGRRPINEAGGVKRVNIYELGSVLNTHPINTANNSHFDHAVEVVNVLGLLKTGDVIKGPFWFHDPSLITGIHYENNRFDINDDVKRLISEHVLTDLRFRQRT